MKRKDYISFEQYFMGLALLASQRSKDPNTQVGACIIGEDNRIISLGYNGFPIGCSDDEYPWDRTAENENDVKYPYVCHAELNAITLCGGQNLKGSTIYVTLFPCHDCAKLIIQSGVKKIIYLSDKYNGTNDNIQSKRMLDSANIKYEQYQDDTIDQIIINYNKE